MTPNIPDEWEYFILKKIRAFDSEFDILIQKENDKLNLQIMRSGKILLNKSIDNGETVEVNLND